MRFRRKVAKWLLPFVRAYIQRAPFSTFKQRAYRRIGWIDHEFSTKTAFGAIVYGNTEDTIQSRIYFFGLWEPCLTRWISQSLKSGDVFVDCGANIGYFSLLASQRVGSEGAVIAVEMSETIMSQLKRHLAVNGTTNVVCHAVALGESYGSATVFRGPRENVGGTSTVEGRSGHDVEGVVPMVPLLEIVPEALRSRVRSLKIDVEGAEASVLRGIPDIGVLSRPDIEVVVEITPESACVVDILRSAGFTAYVIPNDYCDLSAYVRPVGDVALLRFEGECNGLMDLLFSRRDQPVLRPLSQDMDSGAGQHG